MIYDRSKFKEFNTAIDKGQACQVTQEFYWYFLDVLPPAFMKKFVKLVDGRQVMADFGSVEGADRITAFWTTAGAYWAQHTTLFSRGS